MKTLLFISWILLLFVEIHAQTLPPADVTIFGSQAMDQFGDEIISAGDVNGDGFDDLLVAASTYHGGMDQFQIGRVYLFYGPLIADSISATAADAIITGEAQLDHLGGSVAAVGDINKDSFDDVLIGASGARTAGAAYLFYGPFSGQLSASQADVLFEAEAGGRPLFGHAVSPAGDINADGFLDLIVSTPYGLGGGDVYIFLGPFQRGTIPRSQAGATLTSIIQYQRFGYSLASNTDVNGDGIADLVVGAPQPTPNSEGKAYVFFGPLSGKLTPADAGCIITGEALYDQFGHVVASAGDVNNDGFDDVLVGADVNVTNSVEAGSVYLFYGPIKGKLSASAANAIITGERERDWFGQAMARAGDVNRDGFQDLIFGAYGNDANGKDTGRAYLFYGPVYGRLTASQAEVVLTGERNQFGFGAKVNSAGDLDHNGVEDIAVYRPFESSGGTGAGKVFVFHVLVTSTRALNFGKGLIDEGKTERVAIYNPGKTVLRVSSLYFAGKDANQFRANATYFTIAPGDSQIVAIDFKPQSEDTFSASLEIRSDIGNATISLSGIGVSPLPQILSISDVPNDQGKNVKIQWRRSILDTVNSTRPIINYSIWRRMANADQWEKISDLPAAQKMTYETAAPTQFDATVAGVYWSVFYVSAHTQNLAFTYNSAPDSGYSVDNLAPDSLSNLRAEVVKAGIRLCWRAGQENDLDHYSIYRGTKSGFALFYPHLIVRDTTVVDTSVVAGTTYYYRAVAIDAAGNKSLPSHELHITYIPTNITPLPGLPSEFALLQNYPNPLRASASNLETGIQFQLPIGTMVNLTIFDVKGRRLRTLVNTFKRAGNYDVTWDGRDDTGMEAASGLYIYRLEANGLVMSRKMLLVR
jgi:hypothetical protein